MNPFNRTEAVALFLCVAVMALALSVLRFKTDILVEREEPVPQEAVVVASRTGAAGEQELEEVLRDSLTNDGELVKLIVDDVTLGSGRAVEKGDIVTLHYLGTTQSGIKFDSSYDRGKPYSFEVGAGRVIRGWEEGILGMKVGGHRILVIPASMAYGDRQFGIIPPNSTLIFSIELLEIK